MNINEIKEAVERAKTNPLLTANAPEWLQYLIGELEWKDQIIASLQDNYNRALMQDNLSIKVIEELRKALEEVKTLIPLTQDMIESPSLRHNAGNMIMYKIDQALERNETK